MATDPVAKLNRLFERARRARIHLHDAAALATAGYSGRPSVRFILVKKIDRRGIVFYTNTKSRKGKEIRTTRHAALAFFWDKINRQVRIEGATLEISPKEADAYWATRPRESNLSALASDQSWPIASPAALRRKLAAVKKKYRGKDVPRPPHWTGYRIVPTWIEFWQRGKNRLHHRELFVRHKGKWTKSLLQP